jgi:hypothetical protein
VEAAKADYELKPEDEVDSPDGTQDDKGARPRSGKRDSRTVPWSLTKKKETPYLFISPDAAASPDWLEFCQVFKVKPGEKKYEIEVTKLTPFPQAYPAEGVKVIDLETRSLLQVLYFLAHGVEVPPEHAGAGLARMTLDVEGRFSTLTACSAACSRSGRSSASTGRRTPPSPSITWIPGTTSTSATTIRAPRSRWCCTCHALRWGRPPAGSPS